MIFSMLLSNPYPWIFCAAIFSGAALSSLTRRPAQSGDPEKAREHRGFFIAVSLTLTVIFFLCAMFVPGPEKMKDVTLLFFYLIVTAVFFLVFRFKKAAGIPFFLLAGGFILAVILFLQAVVAFTGETEIARLEVLSVENNTMKFRLVDHAGAATELSMPGSLLGAEVKEIIFHDFFVFFGAKTAYRFTGLKSADRRKGSEMTQELRAYELARPSGIPEALWQFVSANQEIIPGIKTTQIQITYVPVKPNTAYSIRIQHDSGVEIIRAALTQK